MIEHKGHYVEGPFRIWSQPNPLKGIDNLKFAVLADDGRAIAWTFSKVEAEILQDALNRKDRGFRFWGRA